MRCIFNVSEFVHSKWILLMLFLFVVPINIYHVINQCSITIKKTFFTTLLKRNWKFSDYTTQMSLVVYTYLFCAHRYLTWKVDNQLTGEKYHIQMIERLLQLTQLLWKLCRQALCIAHSLIISCCVHVTMKCSASLSVNSVLKC